MFFRSRRARGVTAHNENRSSHVNIVQNGAEYNASVVLTRFRWNPADAVETRSDGARRVSRDADARFDRDCTCGVFYLDAERSSNNLGAETDRA